MRIAILGWGSLIWNLGKLRVASQWRKGGPVLPIEFSRISDNGRLTLVIDEKHGVAVPTRYTLSAASSLDEAIADLQRREGIPNSDRVGFVDIPRDRISSRACAKHPTACRHIRTWAEERKLGAIVWTALDPRFEEKAGEPFSADAAIRYLDKLPDKTKALAWEYIRKAPSEIVTPVRTAAEMAFQLLASVANNTPQSPDA